MEQLITKILIKSCLSTWVFGAYTAYLVDDLGCLFEELLACHVLRLELLYLRLGGLPRLPRRAAPVAVVHAGRLDAEQLRPLALRPRARHHRRAEGPHLQKKAQCISTNYQLVFPIRGYRAQPILKVILVSVNFDHCIWRGHLNAPLWCKFCKISREDC